MQDNPTIGLWEGMPFLVKTHLQPTVYPSYLEMEEGAEQIGSGVATALFAPRATQCDGASNV